MSVDEQAKEALARWDKARAELREAETQLRNACRAFDRETGIHGIRPEGLRFAIEQREKKVA